MKNEKQYTPEQLEAIRHDCEKDGSIIISAAAGSGKTAVLVEHIIGIISDEDKKAPADRLVTVTFTKKAAAEIKSRLEKALKQLITAKSVKKTSSDKRSLDWLNEQLIRLDEARISTISAFCLDILKTYPIEAGLSPGFRNLDEMEAEEFKERAMENALEMFHDENVFSIEERNALIALSGEIGDHAYTEIIYSFQNAATKQPYPEEWADSLSDVYKNSKSIKKGNINITYKMYRSFINIMMEKTDLFRYLTGENKRIAFGTKMQDKLEKDYSLACDWYDWVIKCDLFMLQKEPNNVHSEFDKYMNNLKSLLQRECERASYGKAFSETDLAQLKKNQKKYKLLLDELCMYGKLFLAYQDTRERLENPVKVLIKLFKIFANEFQMLKQTANAVDFNDIEHLCLKLLSRDNYKKEIGSWFHEIIVDEFQDSNKVQYAIFTALSKNKRNLFFVGDVKQSIYRFRSADPRVFISVMQDSDFKLLHLNKNFRSSKEVIETVNGVFDGLMTAEESGGGSVYDESARLVQGLNNPDDTPVSSGAVSEMVLIYQDNEEGVDDTSIKKTDNKEADPKRSEAAYIANRIKVMVRSRFTVTDISIHDNSKYAKRPCTYSDFAVIISALGTVEKEFLEEFEAAGVPVTRGGSGDYLSLREVNLVIDLLTIIDNSYFNDIALMSVLMSPLYNMSADDIARVRAAAFSKKDKDVNIHTVLFNDLRDYIAWNKNDKEESGLLKKINKFLNDIFRWRVFAENNSPSRLIRSVYDEGIFLPLAAASPNAERTLANIKLLIYYADNLSGFTGLDIKHLSGFINFLSDKINDGNKMREAGGGEENTVKLLTIHASKGLEFPICFIARINSTFNKREINSDVIFDDEYGIAARYIDPNTLIRFESFSHKLAQHRASDSMTGEEIRKLYVALTRARDRIILVGAVGTENSDFEVVPKIKQNTYLEWIWNSKAVENKIINVTLLASENHSLNVNQNKQDENESPDSEVNVVQENEILEKLNAVYPRKELVVIPKKLTATQIGVIRKNAEFILNETDDEPSVFPRNPSFLKEKRLTGKKRGDCYHKVMYLLDFEAENYDEQVEGMRERFTKEEYKAIELEQIKDFFQSELGERAVRSRQVYKEYPLYTEISFSELYSLNEDEHNEININELDKRFAERPFVQGVADMFFYEGGEIVLVDYKTNRHPTAEKLKEEYGNQLRIYKKAIEEMVEARVKECWLYSFEIGGVRVV